MDLKKVFSFSGLIAGIAFIYLGIWGLSQSIWQKLFIAIQASFGIDPNMNLDWSQGLLSLGLALGIGSLGLYFLAKNWGTGRYLGIFAAYLILILLITSWLLSQSIN